MKTHKISKADQADLTKTKLIMVARRYFTNYGFAHTSSEDIVAAAHVTRGALYHHFDSKEGLFKAVAEKVMSEITQDIQKKIMAHPDPLEQLRLSCDLFLDATSQPEALQILLIDAPAVISWDEWKALYESNTLAFIKNQLSSLLETGLLKPYPIDALAHSLYGSMHQLALWSATQKHPAIALAEAKAVIDELVLSLRIDNWDTTQ